MTEGGEEPRPRSPFLIVNPKSGDRKAERVGLADAARARAIDVHVLTAGDELQEIARQAIGRGADALGVAGGDGSLGLVADIAMRHDVPFVCVPAGTRNHFARDIGLDRNDVLAALDAFAGEHRRVDAGQVNDRVFLNNVTLGVYAEIVHRPGYRENKFGVASEVLPELFNGSRQPSELHFADPQGRQWDSAFAVLVANNPYDLINPSEFGVRARLDLGRLAITVIDANAASEFAGVAASALLGRLGASSSFHQWVVDSFEIESSVDELPVGLDGEALTFRPPLVFESRPGALRLLVPPGTGGPRAAKRKIFGRRTLRDLIAVARGRA